MEENKEEKLNNSSTSKGIPGKTIILIIVLALVAGILTYIAVNQKTPTQTKKAANVEKITNPADTTLSISDSSKDESSSTYSSVVTIDTGKNQITGVQLELYYDPKLITNVSITPLDFLSSSTEVLKKIDPTNGRISYALSTSQPDNGKSGKGNLAKITYSPVLKNQRITATFSFLPKTEVSGIGTDVSLLKKANNGVIDIEPVFVSNSSTNSAK